jgi:hypothetical protein
MRFRRNVSFFQICGIAMSLASAAVSAFGFGWPKSLIFCVVFFLIAGASLGFLVLESNSDAERRVAQEQREIQSAEALADMRTKLAQLYAEKFEREASRLPETLRKFTLDLSSQILRFVVVRDASAITPKQAYQQKGRDWQSLYWPQLGDHYRESFKLYEEQYEKQVQEIYRQIQRHGKSDPELERAMTDRTWPTDIYVVAERLGQLAEGL